MTSSSSNNNNLTSTLGAIASKPRRKLSLSSSCIGTESLPSSVSPQSPSSPSEEPAHMRGTVIIIPQQNNIWDEETGSRDVEIQVGPSFVASMKNRISLSSIGGSLSSPISKLALDEDYFREGTEIPKGKRMLTLSSHDQRYGFNIIGMTKSSTSIKGIFVSKIGDGSVAHRSRGIFVGDQVLAVNGRRLEQATHSEGISALRGNSQLSLELLHNFKGFEAMVTQLDKQDILIETPPINEPIQAKKVVLEKSAKKTKKPTSDQAPNVSSPNNNLEVAIHASSISLSPLHDIAHLRLGIHLLEVGQNQEAYEHFLQALHPKVDRYLQNAIMDAAQLNDPEQAKAFQQRILEQAHEDKGGVYYLIGCALYKMGRREEGQTQFSKAVQLVVPWYYYEGLVVNPIDPEFHYSLGSALATSKEENLIVALMAYGEALKLRPNKAWAVERAALVDRLASTPQNESSIL